MATNSNVARERNQLNWEQQNQSFALPGDRRWEGRAAENEDVLQGEFEEDDLADEVALAREWGPDWHIS